MSGTLTWVEVCEAEAIEEEDVMRFDRGGSTYAVYHTPSGFWATDGWCTHERAHLADGLVIDEVIECPKHNGRFRIPNGKALSAPVCVDLRTYPVRVEGGKLLIGLPG